MAELMQENVIFLVLALLVGLVVAWWFFAASRRTRVEIAPKDSDDEPARRNQALIDAPPAVQVPPAASESAAGVGEAAIDLAPVLQPGLNAGDDLTRIKGLGPKLAQQLGELGITSFAQIAAWDETEIDRIDAQLGRFQGRIRRDDWRAQASLLAAGDIEGYQAKFGAL